MKKNVLAIWLILTSINVYAMDGDDPILTRVRIDQLEIRDTNGPNPQVWDATAWIGKDLQKIWLKSKGERVDSETKSQELSLLYGQAIAPYWDVMVGLRTDLDPNPKRNWLELGVQGLAPYFFETEAALFVGESGRTGVRLKTEYEWMLTQKWVLSPEVELNIYGHNDKSTGVGSGLSSLEAGLRLRYEMEREFSPYIGINWEKTYGNTAKYARAAGESTSDTQFVMGIRAWF